MNDSLKMFLIALVTSVGVHVLLGPYLPRIGEPPPARPPATVEVAASPPPAAAPAAQAPPEPAPTEPEEEPPSEAEALQVPDVIGLPLENARTKLVEAGFEVPTPTPEAAEGRAPGEVVRQFPNPGAQARRSSVVRLVVSVEKVVKVPKVKGIYLTKAREELQKAGLEVGDVRYAEHAELGQNYVLRQMPEADVEVAPGTKVDLLVVAPN